jgi:hypothetical protein
VVHRRDSYLKISSECRGKGRLRLGLVKVVKLLQKASSHFCELFFQAKLGGDGAEERPEELAVRKIRRNRSGNIFVLNLHRKVGSIAQTRPMDLAERRTRERDFRPLGK